MTFYPIPFRDVEVHVDRRPVRPVRSAQGERRPVRPVWSAQGEGGPAR